MGNTCVGDARPLAEDGRVVSEPVCADSVKPEAVADLDPEAFSRAFDWGDSRAGAESATAIGSNPPPPAAAQDEALQDASGSYLAPAAVSRIVGDGVCAICLEPLRTQAQTIAMCGHVFHRDCINKCGSAFCPQCRHLIDRPAGNWGKSSSEVVIGYDGPLASGTRVVLCGLHLHVERNGLHASVVSQLSAGDPDCYMVRMIESGQLFRVRQENLLVLAPSDADSATQGGSSGGGSVPTTSAMSLDGNGGGSGSSSSSPPAPGQSATVQVGSIVELTGLAVAHQFNGQMAEVIASLTAGRYEVRLLSDGAVKVVRGENLRQPNAGSSNGGGSVSSSSTSPPPAASVNAPGPAGVVPATRNGIMTVNEFIAHSKRCRRRGVEVTKLELTAWARYLGMDPQAHPDLVWIAYEALKAPLPPEWSEHYDSDGRVYYFNLNTRVSSWTHPLEQVHRHVYQRLTRCKSHQEPTGSAEERRLERGLVLQWCDDAIKDAERELQVWTEHSDDRGDRFYFNHEQRRSNWGNPRPALLHIIYLHKNAQKVLACTLASERRAARAAAASAGSNGGATSAAGLASAGALTGSATAQGSRAANSQSPRHVDEEDDREEGSEDIGNEIFGDHAALIPQFETQRRAVVGAVSLPPQSLATGSAPDAMDALGEPGSRGSSTKASL